MKKHEVFVRFGRVWLAVGLWMLASSLLVFGIQYRSFWGGDSNPDWRLRVLITVGVVIGFNGLTSLIIRPMVGPLVARSMLRRMIVATLVLGAYRLINREISFFSWLESGVTLAVILSVALVAVWWRWLPYRGATFTISSVVLFAAFYLVMNVGLSQIRSLPFLSRRIVWALLIGGGWSVVCGVLVAWSARANGATPLQEWADNLAYQMRPVSRWRLVAGIVGTLAVSGWVVWSQGVQNCQWIDQLTERSGCYRTIAVDTRSFGGEALAISADGSTLLNVEREAAVLYRIDGTEINRWIMPTDSEHQSAALSTDGSLVAINHNDFSGDGITSTVRLYQSNGTLLHTVALTVGYDVPLLGFSRDGQTLLVDDEVWRVADGAALGMLKPGERGQYHRHPNGHSATTDDGSLTARIYGGYIGVFRPSTEGTIGTLIHTILSTDEIVVFSPDATHLATTDRFDATAVHIWRISDGANVQTIDLLEPIGDLNGVETLVWTPDGDTIIVAHRYQSRIDFYRVK